MANTLKCPSSGYSYTFSGESKSAQGKTEELARAAALGKFVKDAESTAKKAAIDDATNDNNCDGSCELDVTVGTAKFVQTAKAGTAPDIVVTVTVQVPVTLSCGQREVVALAVVAESPILAAAIALRATPISEVRVLLPFGDDLSALGIEDIAGLLKEAGEFGSGKSS